MAKIKVIINGALGRMGQQIVAAVAADPELELVGAADIKAQHNVLYIPGTDVSVPLVTELRQIIDLQRSDVVIDFSLPDAVMTVARTALNHDLHMVIGTTGLTEADIQEIDALSRQHERGVVIAANFSMGAVVLMHLAKIASKFFNHAEIIELHHEKKLDAPSGTALATAELMLKGRGGPFEWSAIEKQSLQGTRGGEKGGITIHSVRLPGLIASQEVVFGALGQTLTLRHDTISRDSFMPGIILAVKRVVSLRGVVYGLHKLLDLGD